MNNAMSVFNPENLITLGYYQDFWELYNKIIEVYNDTLCEYKTKNINTSSINPRTWNEITRKKVRKLCEPILNKYSFLFYGKQCPIYANAYGFSTFSILHFQIENYEYVYSFISFPDFLIVLLDSVTRIISRWKNSVEPESAYPEVQQEITSRIQLLIDTENQNPLIIHETHGDTLSHVNHYILFKQWLEHTDNLSKCPDAVSFAFSINKFLQRRICTQDIWEIINKKRYALLYNCRKHPQYQRSKYYAETREQVLRFCFEYLGKSFDSYIQYEAERTLSENSKPNTLYLHQGNIACLRYHHPTNDVLASIAVNSDTPIRTHATRCWKCNIVFMHKNYYLHLRKQHPFIVSNFCEIDTDGYSPIKDARFAAESPLKLCGYSARNNSVLTETDRQAILSTIIENGILSKAELLQYLSHFILFNGSKDENYRAVSKWESDYNYVINLDIEDHPIVNIDEVKPYSNRKQ